MITIISNGGPVELAEGATVTDLLTALGLGGRWVLVERNGEPVDRRRLDETALADGDRLELVRAVAGGSG
ncbi:sulfur carrier protein ThiS [soil metagenome]